jgi:hypothetical protein
MTDFNPDPGKLLSPSRPCVWGWLWECSCYGPGSGT